MMGARIEAHLGDNSAAETLVNQCIHEIPEKQEGIGYLELAKHWEMRGDI